MNAVNILIVDDEVNIRLMLRTLLEGDGFRVSEASNGCEALDRLEREDFDLLILDLNMPVLDGIGVLEQLKAAHIDPKPRVIVLTAYGSIATAVRATQLGAVDFLEKPATPDEIRQTVTAVEGPQLPESPAKEVPGGYAGVLSRGRRAIAWQTSKPPKRS